MTTLPAFLHSALVMVVCLSASPALPLEPVSQPVLSAHFADADDRASVVAGKVIYLHACAGCHGRSLQGQPLWQLDDVVRRRAPAQDDTGHTWQHSDETIFQMVKWGRFSQATSGVTAMPAFVGRLSDKEIINVISFIEARWSIGLRAAQSSLNPGMAGMPKDIGHLQWTLPPICAATQRRWRNISR